VFSRANCIGCHKWHGNGGGGYGGDALSLRKTELTREQIIETVGCGRPGTGMPFFTRGAYDEVKCHGMSREDAAAQMPPEAGTFLRPKDIEAVADYVIAHIKGAGEPTYAECVAFFSSGSRVCDNLQDAEAGGCRRQPREEPVMDRPRLSGILAAGLLALQAVALANSPARTEDFSGNDLRDIRLGMAAAELEESGYAGFACAADPKHTLAGWTNWRDCPADASATRAIRFGYDPSISRDGTVVAGHPAILTLLIDDSGHVAGLQIETDPKARRRVSMSARRRSCWGSRQGRVTARTAGRAPKASRTQETSR